MPAHLELEYRRRPEPLAYLWRALTARPAPKENGFPSVQAKWHHHRVPRRQVKAFERITGLSGRDGLPILFLHALTFRLMPSMLSHSVFPASIWGLLQIRNNMVLHRPVTADEPLDISATTASAWILDKHAELDVQISIHSKGEPISEELVTVWYPGAFGPPGPASPLARAPALPEQTIAHFVPTRGEWAYSEISGDWNPLHLSARAARKRGRPDAFHHPQIVLGQAMARVPAPTHGRSQRLDAWYKGPIYYGCSASLRAEMVQDASVFALVADGETRPAMLARWGSCPPGTRLVEETGAPLALQTR